MAISSTKPLTPIAPFPTPPQLLTPVGTFFRPPLQTPLQLTFPDIQLQLDRLRHDARIYGWDHNDARAAPIAEPSAAYDIIPPQVGPTALPTPLSPHRVMCTPADHQKTIAVRVGQVISCQFPIRADHQFAWRICPETYHAGVLGPGLGGEPIITMQELSVVALKCGKAIFSCRYELVGSFSEATGSDINIRINVDD